MGSRKKFNHYQFNKDSVYIFPEGNDTLYTIVDYKWYEYLKNYYVMYKKDRENGYYWTIKQDGKQIKIHNIIGGKGYDHINRNKSDNRESNLRPSTLAQNARNRSVTRRSKSGYKGVFLYKKSKKYTAQIRYNYNLYYLGSYDTKEEAAIEYDKASLFLFKEFAWLNFPDNKYDLTNYKLPEKSLLKRKRKNKTGFRGVSKNGNRFVAKFKKIYLGSFKTAEDAARAYDNYLKENNINGLLNFEEENK